MNKRVFWAIVPAVCISIGAVSLAAGGWKLSVNGHSVSTSAQVIGGVTYVPIRDVARALGLKVSVAGTTITLRPASVAAPPAKPAVIDTSKGTVGEELSAGKWGFQVVDVQRATTFGSQFRTNSNRVASYDAKDGEELIIVSCRLKNQSQQTANFAFPQGVSGMNTALSDQAGVSYRPTGYDVFAGQSEPLGKTAAAGAVIPFNIVFRVSAGARLKKLVYSVVIYGELTDNKSTDFSVDLAAP